MADDIGVSDTDLKAKIRDLLKDADLSTLSAKKVRLQLEKHFKVTLDGRKQEIDQMIMDQIDSNTQSEDVQEDSDSGDEVLPEVSQTKQTSEDVDSGDEILPEISQTKQTTTSQSSKQAKSNTGATKEKKLNDEEYARRLQELQDSGERITRKRSRSVLQPEKKAKKPRKKREPKEAAKFHLSEDLADLLGEDQMSRPAIIKRIWEIIKERNLQDPKKKSNIICDDQFRKIVGTKQTRAFTIMKHLEKHIYKPD